MPISEESNKILYNTDGLIREFSFNFKFLQPSNIKVSFWTKDDKDNSTESVELEEGKDYTLIYDDAEEGGFVVLTESSAEEQAQGKPKYPATPTSGTLLVARIMPLDQQAHIRPVSGFPEEVITNTFDKLVMIDQQQQEQLDRCVKVSDVSDINPEVLVQQVERIHAGIEDIVVVADHIEDVEYVAANGEDILEASEASLANVNAAKEQADIATEQADIATEQASIAATQASVAAEQAGIATTQAGISTAQAGISTAQANIVKEQKIIVEQLSQATNDIFLDVQSIERKVSQDLVVSKGHAQAALTQAGVATEQAGIAATQADIATEQAGISTAQASVATEQAGIAATQAGIAATQADIATASAYNSEISERASAASANNSKVWAEGTDEEVRALGGVHSSKTWAEIGSDVGGRWGNILGDIEDQSDLQAALDGKANTSDIPDLTGYIKNKEAMTESIVIGNTSTASNAIVIGTNQRATGRYSIAVGDDCTLSNTSGISIGRSNTLSGTSNIAIGGTVTTSGGNSIGIGRGSCKATGTNALAIGTGAQATGSSQSLAIGYGALATQNSTIQLGLGTNNTADSLQVWNYPLLNKADGKIYADRLPESGGLPIGMVIPVTASASHVPENTLYCDASEFTASSGEMFTKLYNNYLVGKVKLISALIDVYYSSSKESILAIKLGSDVTTQEELIIDNGLSYYIAYIKDGYLMVGDRANSSGIQQTAVEANSVVYIKLKIENGSLMVSSGTSKSNLSEPFVFSSGDDLSTYFEIIMKNTSAKLLSSSVINGKALYANDAFCSDVVVYGTPTITDGGDSIEGARLETCTYGEYQTELTMTGSCYKWAVDIENQKFRIPFIPDKVLVDVANTVDVKGNGMTLGLIAKETHYGLGNWTPASNSTYTGYTGLYGKPTGTAVTGNKMSSAVSLGVTPEAENSGIIADATNAKTYKKIRHYVVVATGSINQNEADWSEFASSLASKANKTDVDGQWVVVPGYPILTTATAVGDYTLDISDYLPVDNYVYDVMFSASTYNTATTQKCLYIGTDIMPINTSEPSAPVKLLTDSSVVKMSRQTIVLPTLNKTILTKITGGTFNEASIRLIAYRRIGTNQ